MTPSSPSTRVCHSNDPPPPFFTPTSHMYHHEYPQYVHIFYSQAHTYACIIISHIDIYPNARNSHVHIVHTGDEVGAPVQPFGGHTCLSA